MASELNTHNEYMMLSFRPMIMPDGSVKRVGVQSNTPVCVDPEVYPNLLTAAPAMYQALANLRQFFHVESGAVQIEAIEAVLAFAQNGFLACPNVYEMIKKAAK